MKLYNNYLIKFKQLQIVTLIFYQHSFAQEKIIRLNNNIKKILVPLQKVVKWNSRALLNV